MIRQADNNINIKAMGQLLHILVCIMLSNSIVANISMLLLWTWFASCVASDLADFEGNCRFYPDNSRHNCSVALFSITESFHINGSLAIIHSKLCEPEKAERSVGGTRIALVSRGECPFDR